MEIGALFLLKNWTNIVGFNILSANILAWILAMGSLLIPYYFLQSTIERKANINYLTIGILFTGCFTYNLYNPDAPTLFLTSCLATVILYNIENVKCKTIMLIGVLIALLISVRFPNIVVLPMICLFLTLAGNNTRSKIKNIVVCCLTSAITYIGIICLLSGRIDFYGYFSTAITEGLQLSDDAHGFYTLFHSYVFSLIPMIWKTGTLFSIFLFSYIVKLYRKWYYGLIVSLLLIFVLHKLGGINYVNGFREMFGGCVILILFHYSWIHRKDKIELMRYFILFLLMFVGVAGSDTGLMKIYHFSVVVFLIITLRERILSKYKNECKFLLLPTLMFSIFSFYSPFFENKKYEVFSKINNVTQFMSSEEEKKIKEAAMAIKAVKKTEKLIIYGSKAHVIYSMFNIKLPYLMPFYMKAEDTKQIELAIRNAKKLHNATIIDLTNSEVLKQAAIQKGMKKISDTNFNIYNYN